MRKGILEKLVEFLGSYASENTEVSEYRRMREWMVATQLIRRGITDLLVIKAMKTVPRHEFVPEKIKWLSYDDCPLPIGYGQTISQPYVVALMTELLEPEPDDKVLEIGTGSGYQAAVLAEIVKEVYSMEILEELAAAAGKRLSSLGYKNVRVKCGDSYDGWKEYAPFDKMIVTCSPDHTPEPLYEQLKDGGRMVIPVGIPGNQDLKLLIKGSEGVIKEDILPVKFVPMTGKAKSHKV